MRAGKTVWKICRATKTIFSISSSLFVLVQCLPLPLIGLAPDQPRPFPIGRDPARVGLAKVPGAHDG
jgi:hypothetical protein